MNLNSKRFNYYLYHEFEGGRLLYLTPDRKWKMFIRGEPQLKTHTRKINPTKAEKDWIKKVNKEEAYANTYGKDW